MTRIDEKEVNKLSECNFLHDIINPPKHAKNINIHYSPILHGCMNIRKGRAKFKRFQVLLDSGRSSKIVMVILVEKINHEKDTVMQWYAHTGNITTNLRVKIYFTLTTLSAKTVVTWKCHMYDSANGGYDMILAQDL